jgi:chaperone BCS1
MWQTLMDQFSSNAFLSGGLILGIAGSLLVYLRSLPLYIYGWLKRRIVTEIDIPDRDEAFKWVNYWLSQHPYKKRCRWWTVSTKRQRDDDTDDALHHGVRPRASKIILSPAPGIHLLFYRRRLMILYRSRKDSAAVGKGSAASAMGIQETFTIKLFSRNKQIAFDLITEARDLANPSDCNRIKILRPEYNEWVELAKRLPRPFDSVVLADNIGENLLEDVRHFIDSETWYNERGIPYRRGYLLSGPPGNGKTSIVTAISSELHLDICILNLSTTSLTDERLSELMANVPLHSIVLVEDVDCVFKERKKNDEHDNITFSGFLNAIDGVMASEGRILFMTTNSRDKLDIALTRPGRVDVDLLIDNATKKQASTLFIKFFPGHEFLAEAFGSKVADMEISMATLQGILVKNKHDPDAVLAQNLQLK